MPGTSAPHGVDDRAAELRRLVRRARRAVDRGLAHGALRARRARRAIDHGVVQSAGVRRASRWWRRRSVAQARGVLAGVALLGLLCGMGTTALVTGGEDPAPRAGVGAPLPGSTTLGPVAMVLPDELGPWSPVPQDRLEPLRMPSGDGVVFDGAWAVLAPEGVLLTVMTAPAGTHPGLGRVLGAFDRTTLPWQGGTRYVAGVGAAGDVTEGVLATELPGGELVIVTISGPQPRLDAAGAVAVLATARFPPDR